MRKLAQSQRSSELCIFHGIWGNQPSQQQLPTGTVDGADVAVQAVVCFILRKVDAAALQYCSWKVVGLSQLQLACLGLT